MDEEEGMLGPLYNSFVLSVEGFGLPKFPLIVGKVFSRLANSYQFFPILPFKRTGL